MAPTTVVRVALAALLGVAAVAVSAAPALADTQPDPQLSNIPYLAWRGEEVRLVKCEPDVLPEFANGAQAAQSIRFGDSFIDFLLVDWSGDPHLAKPQLEQGTVSAFFRSFDGAPCVAGTFVSQKAGLAQIKLVATLNFSQAEGFPVGIPEVITLKHDFNVGWMHINTANLSVVGGTTTDTAGGAGNQLQLLVNGTIPLLGNYGELGLGDSLTMPNDWAGLANAMATFRDPLDPNPAMRWDIHDEFSPTQSPDQDLHGAQSACPTHTTTLFLDTVDNCTGEPWPLSEALPPEAPLPPITDFEVGLFSRVWQNFTGPTIGPFDPQRPQQTLLSNGILDAGDAPMPSARVDFAIAPNSGAAGDISGVGLFSPADKHLVYARADVADDTPHNLYGPFYASWNPATASAIVFGLASVTGLINLFPPLAFQVVVPEASGVHGTGNISQGTCGKGNNFNGFLNQCAYHFWDFAAVLREGPGGESGCLPLVAGGEPPEFNDAPLPFGEQQVVVYTDEHGEARTNYNPGIGFFFLNLQGVAINANGGCDIANIPGGVLGTASITATVKYPFEPVTARSVVSNSVVKTVTSLFSKTITCYPKGSQPEEQNAAICVAQATDITGAPFVGETVCFFADFNAEDIQHFSGSIPGTSITIGQTLFPQPPDGELLPYNVTEEARGLRRKCPYTDENGRAAVEIFNSNPTTVDVQALFVDEGILRHLLVPFPIHGQVGPATGTAQNPTPNNPGPNNPGPDASPGPDSSPGPAVTPFKVAKVRLVRLSRTKATVLLRVTGPQGRVPVRIRFSAANKQARTVTRMVRTNRLVKLRNLRTPNAKRLRLSVSLVS